jgi:acyl-CoA synthetase (AMP-forming)/AMP-acid ligase II
MFQTPPGIGIGHFLDFPIARVPHKTALIDDRESLTFAETAARASRLARAFAAAGAKPGDRVALILPNVTAFIVTEIAILRAGMVKVPLNIRFHMQEVLYAVADCEPTIVVCDGSFAGDVLRHRDEIASVKAVFTVGLAAEGAASWDAAVAEGDAVYARVPFAPDDPVLIRYTGGTTGRPKGIVHTEASYLACALDVMREKAIVEGDVALHLGHLSHGMNFVWPAFFAAGATQVLRERFEPRQVWGDFSRFGITFVYMVPTMIHRLLREDDGSAEVSSLRMFLYASAPMPVPLLRQAITRFGNVFTQVYTLSEVPVITTILRPHEHVERATSVGPRLGSCGRPVVTMEVQLVGDEGKEVKPGEVGEIAVRSVNNMASYWRLPEETAKTLVDGWVLTGDMARRDEDGFFHIVDRKKEIIITGAFNVYPKEVEDVLYRHDGVALCAVVGVPDEEWGEVIKAFVVRKPGAAVGADELIALCRAQLASYKKPRQIEFVESLPLSPIGKVMRRALRRN